MTFVSGRKGRCTSAAVPLLALSERTVRRRKKRSVGTCDKHPTTAAFGFHECLNSATRLLSLSVFFLCLSCLCRSLFLSLFAYVCICGWVCMCMWMSGSLHFPRGRLRFLCFLAALRVYIEVE